MGPLLLEMTLPETLHISKLLCPRLCWIMTILCHQLPGLWGDLSSGTVMCSWGLQRGGAGSTVHRSRSLWPASPQASVEAAGQRKEPKVITSTEVEVWPSVLYINTAGPDADGLKGNPIISLWCSATVVFPIVLLHFLMVSSGINPPGVTLVIPSHNFALSPQVALPCTPEDAQILDPLPWDAACLLSWYIKGCTLIEIDCSFPRLQNYPVKAQVREKKHHEILQWLWKQWWGSLVFMGRKWKLLFMFSYQSRQEVWL